MPSEPGHRFGRWRGGILCWRCGARPSELGPEEGCSEIILHVTGPPQPALIAKAGEKHERAIRVLLLNSDMAAFQAEMSGAPTRRNRKGVLTRA